MCVCLMPIQRLLVWAKKIEIRYIYCEGYSKTKVYTHLYTQCIVLAVVSIVFFLQ